MATRKKSEEPKVTEVKEDLKPAPATTDKVAKVEEPQRKDDAPEAVIPPAEDGKAEGGPASEAEIYAASRAVHREGHRPQYYDLEAIAKDLRRGVKARVAVAQNRRQ